MTNHSSRYHFDSRLSKKKRTGHEIGTVYKQQDATLHKLFISVKCSTCFRRFFLPSPGAQKLYIQHRVLCQIFSPNCLSRGRDGTGLSVRQHTQTSSILLVIQGGSNMTGTDLCVNKLHCAAAVRP